MTTRLSSEVSVSPSRNARVLGDEQSPSTRKDVYSRASIGAEVLHGGEDGVEAYSYDAFGAALNFDPNTAKTNWLFGGDGLWDPNSLFTYHLARFRDGARFLSYDSYEADPSAPASLHKYLYAGAQPVATWDPSGRFSLKEIAIVTAIVVIALSVLGFGIGLCVPNPTPTTIHFYVMVDASTMPREFGPNGVQQALGSLLAPLSPGPDGQVVKWHVIASPVRPTYSEGLGWQYNRLRPGAIDGFFGQTSSAMLGVDAFLAGRGSRKIERITWVTFGRVPSLAPGVHPIAFNANGSPETCIDMSNLREASAGILRAGYDTAFANIIAHEMLYHGVQEHSHPWLSPDPYPNPDIRSSTTELNIPATIPPAFVEDFWDEVR